MKTKFLDLGLQPIANGFKKSKDEDEFKFNLGVTFDDETKLVSLTEFVKPELLFNDQYPYRSSQSETMRAHFERIAYDLDPEKTLRVLEIGCNDGAFLKNFKQDMCVGIEPCSNFAKELQDQGYSVLPMFWNKETAKTLVENYGKFDIVYAANCFCHIPDIQEALQAVNMVLKDSQSMCILEDPSLLSMMQLCSYDQIYDEHAHIFSITALSKLCRKASLFINDVERLSVHGFSNRVIISRIEGFHEGASNALLEESLHGLDDINTYKRFNDSVRMSRAILIDMLNESTDRIIIGYGATSKATVVLNYCGVSSSIECFLDTTPEKQGKFMPGTNTPIIPREGFILDPKKHLVFLGAWNYINEIQQKEKEFVKDGGKFLTHIPFPRIV